MIKIFRPHKNNPPPEKKTQNQNNKNASCCYCYQLCTLTWLYMLLPLFMNANHRLSNHFASEKTESHLENTYRRLFLDGKPYLRFIFCSFCLQYGYKLTFSSVGTAWKWEWKVTFIRSWFLTSQKTKRNKNKKKPNPFSKPSFAGGGGGCLKVVTYRFLDSGDFVVKVKFMSSYINMPILINLFLVQTGIN